MAKEIVQSLREVNGKYEQYYFATVLSAVAVTDADDETRNAKEYIDSLISATTDAMRFMGVIGAGGVITSSIDATSGKTFSTLTNYKIGWSFKVGEANTYAGQKCEIGDMLICVGTNGNDSDWYVLQANIDGAVTGPASAADNAIAMFDGTTGKLLADSGFKKTDIQGLLDVKHTHANKDTLDATTAAFTTELKTLLENLNTTVSQNNHNHLNKAVLDSITQEMVDLWNAYDSRITALESAVVYTNDTPMVNAHGGIAAGETFNNVPITEMLTKILYPYVAPIVSASIITPANGGVVEKGSTQNVTKIRVNVTKKSSSITKVEIFDGSTSLGSKTEGVASGGTFDFTVAVNVTSNKNFTAKVTDSVGKTTSANTGTFTFVHPIYYGACAANATVNASLVTGLTKKVESKGAKSLSYTCNNQCMVFAYDASYGNLKSIIDPNNFNVTDTFTKSEVNITTLDGASTKYYVYKNSASTVSAFTMKFNF